MRREQRTLARLVLAVLAVGTTAGCGADGEAAEEPPAEVTTTRRSDNEAACDQLRLVAEIDAETARLSGGVARQVIGGAQGAAVLAAADELAAHLSTNAPVVAAAYTDAAADAPEAVAAAIAELAAASAATMPELAELLGSATSADEIADLYETLGAAGVADDVDPGAVAEVERYRSVICNMPSG